MRQEKITLACVTKPHLKRLRVLLPKVLPYVDKAVIVIGEKDPKTIQYLKTLKPKVSGYYYKWHDNFAASWNTYLRQIQDGWILILDDDEVPSDNMLESLDDYVNNSARGEKYCAVGFRCNPISEGEDLGPCDYYRQIFFRYNPGMYYASADPESGSHQCLMGYQNGSIIHSKPHEVYYHIKSLKDEYRNASRNFYHYGIWVNDTNIYRSEEWHELKAIVKRVYPDVETFPDLDRKLQAGNIHQDLKDWMVKWYTALRDHPERNEMRALVVYYMKYLHSEEKPEGLELS